MRNIDRLREKQLEHAKSIDGIRASHEEHKIKVVNDTKEMYEKYQNELKSLHTGDLTQFSIGLWCLFIGIPLSTMAPELFQLIDYLFL